MVATSCFYAKKKTTAGRGPRTDVHASSVWPLPHFSRIPYLPVPSQITDKIKLIKRGATCTAGSFEEQVKYVLVPPRDIPPSPASHHAAP